MSDLEIALFIFIGLVLIVLITIGDDSTKGGWTAGGF